MPKKVPVHHYSILNRFKQLFHGHWSYAEVPISDEVNISVLQELVNRLAKSGPACFETSAIKVLGRRYLFYPRKLDALASSSQIHFGQYIPSDMNIAANMRILQTF